MCFEKYFLHEKWFFFFRGKLQFRSWHNLEFGFSIVEDAHERFLRGVSSSSKITSAFYTDTHLVKYVN